MKTIFFMVFGLFVMNVDCVQQKCKVFEKVLLTPNTDYGDLKSYYQCKINDANLTDESKIVTTETQLNPRSDDDVTMVLYDPNNILKFIPNSLFTTFINLEYFFIRFNYKLEIIKPEFFENAKKLKIIRVNLNDVKTLGPKLFAKAAKLEHINFKWNKIESIHKLVFDELPNLKGIYLEGNKISSLHPSTFSFITKLNILELSDNTCLDQTFSQANQKVSEIEAEINESCDPGYSHNELAAIEKAKKLALLAKITLEEKLEEQKELVTELEAKLNEQKKETLKISQELATYQDEKFNQTIHNLSSIIEAQMIIEMNFSNTIAEHTKKFEKVEELIKILLAKQEMDAKMIEELNEKLKKLEVRAFVDENHDKLEAKIIKLVEEKFVNQKNEIQDLGATKVELLGKRIHDSLVIVIQDLQGTESSLDARVRKLEKKAAGTWTD